jgi:ADP-heptose:LPS heptosyltransferase
VSPLYSILSRLFPALRQPFPVPRRVVLILPCCIGDVVLSTAVLCSLRRAYPDAHIIWAVGSWSRDAIARHPDLNGTLDTGPAALPVKTPGGFWRFVRQLRAGNYDLAISLIRSPLMSLAVALSGIPVRAGVDSAGRGFGYNVRAAVDPATERHEAEIYLDVARVLGIEAGGCYAATPPHPDDLAAARRTLESLQISGPFAVINPAGGSNPGMVLDAKRYPPHGLSVIARGLQANGLKVVIVAGPKDGPIVEALQREMDAPLPALAGALTLTQTGALASLANVYIGNDTGLTHLAAASGAKTVMLMGPSSPKRYAPFTLNSLAVWKPADVPVQGVVSGAPRDWDWSHDGIPPEEALAAILQFIR